VLGVPVITSLTLLLVAAGALLAYRRYAVAEVPLLAPQGWLLTRAARRDLYQDAVNEAVLMRPGQYLTRSLVFVDNRGVDGAVGGLAALVGGLGGRLRRWNTGYVRSYAMSMLVGVIAVGGGVLLARI
jgi:NADH-quinone oxidoreductase subunit L